MSASKLKDPRTCRVFLSSPFGGMEEEREELTRKYFPQFHHLCNSHGLQFVAVDMRWGITSEASDSAQTINICLREIDRSDIFVGFFGQRYGWHGIDDTALQRNFEMAVGNYLWLKDVRDRSVTELEFLHGHLNQPGKLPACIYFRDKSYDDMRWTEYEKKGDKKGMFKYSAENDKASQMMDDLKARLCQTADKCLDVEMSYKTPAEMASKVFDTLWKHMTEVLFKDIDIGSRTKQESLRSQHDAFLKSRCNVYVGCDSYLTQLDNCLNTDSKQPVLVTGVPGIGKSALLCNWLSGLQKRVANCVLVYHFVGYAENSTDSNNIAGRLLKEFDHHVKTITGTTQETEDSGGQEDNIQEVMRKMIVSMERLLSLNKVPVLVIDGLDKVTSTSKIVKPVYWIPSTFPAGVVVVVSTVTSDITTIQELHDNRNYKQLEVLPLPVDVQENLCVKALQETGKELSPAQLKKIVSVQQTENPLFLTITLSELIQFGYFRLLDKKIDSLIQSPGIEDLFQKFLDRLEEDYNVPEYGDNLVEQVMCSLLVCHQGLSETELKEIYQIPDYIWSPLYFAMERMIIDQAGLIQFGFTELKEAVVKKYLTKEKRNLYQKKLIDYFQKCCKDFPILISWPGSNGMRPVFELPLLLDDAGDKTALAECLSNRVIFINLQSERLYKLIELWQRTGLDGEAITDMLLKSFDKAIAESYLYLQDHGMLSKVMPGYLHEHFLRAMDYYLDTAGYQWQRSRVVERLIKVLKEAEEKGILEPKEGRSQLRSSQYKLACIYANIGKFEESINLHSEVLHLRERELESNGFQPTPDDITNLGSSYHGLGVAHERLHQFDKAIEYYKQSVEQHEKVNNLDQVAVSWSNLGSCYMNLEKYDLALEYMEKAIKTVEEVNFGHLPPLLGELLTNRGVCHRKMGNIELAESSYKKSLEIKINAVGEEHPIVALAYANLCTLESYKKNYEQARQYAKMAVDIYKGAGYAGTDPEYIIAAENYLNCFTNDQKYQEIDKFYMETLDYMLECGAMDRCLPYMHQEMFKFYVREERYNDALKVTKALLNSSKKMPVNFIHADFLRRDYLPPEETENWPREFTLDYAIELWPDNVDVVKWKCENYLIPSGQADELLTVLNQLHEHTDHGAYLYEATANWCLIDSNMQENCFFKIAQEGLKRYPDNLTLQLNLAKSLYRQGQYDTALVHAQHVADQQTDNVFLQIFAAQVALSDLNLDEAKRFRNRLNETFPDDADVQEKVSTLSGLIDETEAHLKSQQDSNPGTEVEGEEVSKEAENNT